MSVRSQELLLATIVLLLLAVTVHPVGAQDPDDSLNFTQIVTNKGYPCEYHEVLTEDGYLLGTFRIPHGKGKPSGGKPVLLFHGLLDSSFTWILNMPTQSLAYILADLGYDVWLGNVRGNRYSQKHTHLTPQDKQFWQFSIDQFAQYDLPNTVAYVLNQTNSQKLSYIAHSQGATQAFAAFNIAPTLASHMNIFIALAPVASLVHQTNSFLRLLATWDVDYLVEWLGFAEFLPSSTIINEIAPFFCRIDPIICDDLIELIVGKHQGSFNESRMQVMAGHEPGGTSVMNMAHWAQFIRSQNFQMYDFGKDGNMAHYNQSTPPSYSLGAVPKTLPIAIFYGDADELADTIDAKALIENLPSPPVYVKELPLYAHLDFVWDYKANTDMYLDVVKLLSAFV